MSKIMNILKEYIKRLFGRPTPQLMLTELRKKGLILVKTLIFTVM